MTVVRVRLFASGRVQGVNFRKFTRREAVRLGLTGWVRNLPDRRVEVVAEGEEERVNELIMWCRRGPGTAIVRGLEVLREAPTGQFDSFTVKH